MTDLRISDGSRIKLTNLIPHTLLENIIKGPSFLVFSCPGFPWK
jgi:hypothetical protein